jgi:feruloyl esterase
MKLLTAGCLSAMLVAVVPGRAQAACEDLTSLTVQGGTVTMAQAVKAGAFEAPGRRGGGPGGRGNPYAGLGEFCRVAVTLRPGPQSDIQAEVWLPSAGWNGKLLVVGNGGFAGTIGYSAMAGALADGYAAASTDTGHTGPASNTFVNEDVLLDFAHRAIHETTVAAKVAVGGLYGRAPRFSYFSGCSTGGRQAFTAAQRYPEDFDGIVGGAPATHTTTQAFGQIWMYQATAGAASSLPRETRDALHGAVLAACDGLDGVEDGVLENPLACTFDPGVLACAPGRESASCLTRPQVEAVRKTYAGPSNARTGEPIYAGLERGSEAGWLDSPVGYAVDYFRYIVFEDPAWDPLTLNFDQDLAEVRKAGNDIFDASDPDMSRFTSRGGKLLMYQGWAEPGIPPRNLVEYHAEILEETANADDAIRLFMVPGMGHCGGGDGTSTFDMVAALDRWVESGTAPESVPASRVRNGTVDRTRPLCAWPAVAVYDGSGSTDDASNFSCRVP